ncbi:hypothetical protein K437DRAFT_154275 [Tilletiaria anomala UBC 951]|uniref:Branchpoint-bridging protein n=1 Tax=Tilletiaria anomala (strain ATCC 24038 / CBS 436.72 / UBC 951) TaxID=1037660 RepID=A0A066VN79_TILAU|nr:uncharacterized protein K437DRAFT_154275 [Tilletiaria anomala UBC 951]KDN43207.1 hypothetical protein K437DRAFT_154275 [Tilletiaria anomala UBC 951]
MKMDPNFKPPAEYQQYKRNQRPTEKVYLPLKEFPEINFFGLIVGPRGNTIKTMERESGAKIAIRGKGSVKEGKGKPGYDDQDEEDMHCVVTADEEAKVKHCVRLINKVIETARTTTRGINCESLLHSTERCETMKTRSVKIAARRDTASTIAQRSATGLHTSHVIDAVSRVTWLVIARVGGPPVPADSAVGPVARLAVGPPETAPSTRSMRVSWRSLVAELVDPRQDRGAPVLLVDLAPLELALQPAQEGQLGQARRGRQRSLLGGTQMCGCSQAEEGFRAQVWASKAAEEVTMVSSISNSRATGLALGHGNNKGTAMEAMPRPTLRNSSHQSLPPVRQRVGKIIRQSGQLTTPHKLLRSKAALLIRTLPPEPHQLEASQTTRRNGQSITVNKGMRRAILLSKVMRSRLQRGTLPRHALTFLLYLRSAFKSSQA